MAGTTARSLAGSMVERIGESKFLRARHPGPLGLSECRGSFVARFIRRGSSLRRDQYSFHRSEVRSTLGLRGPAELYAGCKYAFTLAYAHLLPRRMHKQPSQLQSGLYLPSSVCVAITTDSRSQTTPRHGLRFTSATLFDRHSRSPGAVRAQAHC